MATITTSIPRYDAVIVGGSYAGLAAAQALGERALIIDQHEIGAIQRSACATPLNIARRFNVVDSVLQIYPDAYMHTRYGTSKFKLPAPYCIFDHQRLCQQLFESSGAHFLRARVNGLDGNTVLTTAGPVRGELLIDASGWPATLATARRPELARANERTLGIEAEIEDRGEGIHFYIDARLVSGGYAWVFPAGDTLRIGVGAYDQRKDVKAALNRFMESLGFDGRPRRGGLIPWFERPAVVDDIYLAGDAAGHCLPLTAEGIRFALQFGELSGQLARAVLDGKLSQAEGLAHYHAEVERFRRSWRIARLAQTVAGRLPDLGIYAMTRLLSAPYIEPRFTRRYMGSTA